MPKNIVVFDIETKLSFDEAGGRNNFEKLGVSLIGMYDYLTNKYEAFEENEIDKFVERLFNKPLLVGFNSKKFDIAVLQPYVKNINLTSFDHLDIMEEIQKVLGHRLSLQSVAEATLGVGKSGNGLDALVYYRNGEIEKLKKYCLQDVKITKDVYEFGAKNSQLFYVSKYGNQKSIVKVNWKMPEEDGPSQFALF